MAVTLSVRTAIIIIGSIGVLYGILAMLFGALTFYICCCIKKNRCKVKPDKVKDSFNIKTSPKDEDNVQSDSAYDTSTTKFVSCSMPSSSMLAADNIITSHPPKPLTKSLMVSRLMEVKNCSTEDRMSTGSPYPAINAGSIPDKPLAEGLHNRTGESVIKQNTSGGGREEKIREPVKRTNSYLKSYQPNDSSEPFTVLTVHKSTLKRQKASRSNSQKPLMEDEERNNDDNEESEGEKMAEDKHPEASRKPKASPYSRRVHLIRKSPDYPRPSSKRAARSNSTKPLMLHEEGEDADDFTQEDFDNIQGVEDTGEETLPGRTSEIPTTPPTSIRHSQPNTPPTNAHSLASTPSSSNRHSQATTPSSTSRRIQLPIRIPLSPSRSHAGSPPSSARHSRRESLVLENVGIATPIMMSTHLEPDTSTMSTNVSNQGVDTPINMGTDTPIIMGTDTPINMSIRGMDTPTNMSTLEASMQMGLPSVMSPPGSAIPNESFQTHNPNSFVLKNQDTATPTPTSSTPIPGTERPSSAGGHSVVIMDNLENSSEKSLTNLHSDLWEMITKM